MKKDIIPDDKKTNEKGYKYLLEEDVFGVEEFTEAAVFRTPEEIEEVRQHVLVDSVIKNGEIKEVGDKRFVRMADKFINIDELHIIAKGLLEYETLTGDEINDLLKGIKPNKDDFNDDINPGTTVTSSVPKTGNTPTPQTN